MMLNQIAYLLITIRPKQWLKNFSIYIPILFGGYLFTDYKVLPVAWGFLILCGLSSSVYLLNDYKDRESDRLHPGKKDRPLAAGTLSPKLALAASVLLGLGSVSAAWLLSEYFFLISFIYLIMMWGYSLFLRNLIIVDGMIVAFGFVLRVWAGSLVSETPISSWLILCTTAVALLISFGRRRCEITVLETKASEHRHTLQHYPKPFLDAIITSVAAFSLISYSLFTFLTPNPTIDFGWAIEHLPQAWVGAKWLMSTIPLAIYTIFRYLYIIYEKEDALSPEDALFKDRPLLTTIFLWLLAVIGIIYFV